MRDQREWKFLALGSSALCLLLLFAVSIDLFLSHRAGMGLPLNAPTIVVQVKKLNQLTTVKYSLQRVVGMTGAKNPFGEESILLMVQGQALAGVDLSTVTPDDVSVTRSGTVNIKLPPAKLFHVFLDEKQTKVWDRHITWWTPRVPYDPDLEHKARLTAEQDVRPAALKMGILGEAQRNAEAAVTSFLRAFQVEVDFKPASGLPT
jgi:hypothetical protein